MKKRLNVQNDNFIFYHEMRRLKLYVVLLGNGVDGAKEKIGHHLLGTQLIAWSVWIPAQYFNFFFMPLHMRVIFVQFIALFWNTYMSWKLSLAY